MIPSGVVQDLEDFFVQERQVLTKSLEATHKTRKPRKPRKASEARPCNPIFVRPDIKSTWPKPNLEIREYTATLAAKNKQRRERQGTFIKLALFFNDLHLFWLPS